MPLDTSIYTLAHLRTDGRRWNELRRLHGQLSTQTAADGSASFELGNTKVLCTITGPSENSARGGARDNTNTAKLEVELSIAGFSGVDRRRGGRNDKRTLELQHIIANAFASVVLGSMFPRSTIWIRLHVLSQDGSVLAACLNATTLALIDAGIPMRDYIAACTTGSTASYASNDEEADPLLDLNASEETELPYLTLATVGEKDEVSVLLMESRVQMGRLEGMVSVGLDGCRQIRRMLDEVVRRHGSEVVKGRAR